MLVIYHSYGGACALAAAALHLGRLPFAVGTETRTRALLGPDLLPEPVGKAGGPGLHLQGRDGAGHAVYSLTRNVPSSVIDRAFLGVASVYKLPATAFLLVDAGMPGDQSAFWLAWVMVRLGRTRWAQRLLSSSLERRWPYLMQKVRYTQEQLRNLAAVAR